MPGTTRLPGTLWWALAVLVLTAPAAPAAAQQTVPLIPGMVVTESLRIAPGRYRMDGEGAFPESPVIVVRGEGVTLDLTGVTLEGIDPAADPDLAVGTAVFVEGGREVTVRGGAIRGFRFAVLARGTRGLRLLDADLSYNWKPRLFSLVGHESLVDWLSYHDNEDRQWMRFGAAIYLEDVRGGEVRGVRAVQGMNGLLMTRSDSVTVRDNDFSYNSGLGVGLYRSSRNVIVRNSLDYDVRGYSEGFYQRGQDSAGLLMYEQSSHNVIAYNSATHSGDGFFLWAGNSTMDSGEGGANDNLLFHNDFSFAPTNAVEVTFSRNHIVANYLRGSRYGVWGGYSWETSIRGNCFGGNRYGVAIEHGQENRIVGNHFAGDSLAISLWTRPTQPEDWGYPQNRDVRSRDHVITDNLFTGVTEVWRLEGTEGHAIGRNRQRAAADDGCDPRRLLGAAFDSLAPDLAGVPRAIPTAAGAGLPRSAIVVDAWGPWDRRSPKLWPVDTTRAAVPLAVLGPEGRWRASAMRGVAGISAESGRTGDTLIVIPAPGSIRDWAVTLEYTGSATTSPRGVRTPEGEPVPFAFERFEPAGPWQVRFVSWTDPAHDPGVAPGHLESLLERPVLERTEDRLDYQWFTPLLEGLPQERWGLEATTTVDLPQGRYSLRTISDDGVRVWVDDALVIDHWDAHGAEVDYADLSGGRHRLRVQYHQGGGWTELRVDVVRGAARSTGSAGPHE